MRLEAVNEISSRPVQRCPVCGGDGRFAYQRLVDWLFGAPGEWALRKCRQEQCGVLWLDPMPEDSSIKLAYERYYTHGKSSESLVRKAGKLVYRSGVDALLLIFGITSERRRAECLYLDSSRPGRLLDVGCGDGAFLARMAKRGWTVAGIDFDPSAVAEARKQFGIDARVATFDDLLREPSRFDVITANHVIEHVSDPRTFLRQAAALLNPGGQIVIRTPNVKSYGHARYGQHWRGLEPPRHLMLFTEGALKMCADAVGLKVETCFTTAVGAEFILSESLSIARRASGLDVDPPFLARVKLAAPLLSVRAKLAWHANRGCGEEILATFKRNEALRPAEVAHGR